MKEASYVLVERSIIPTSIKRAPCEWRFNDRGLPRWFVYHVHLCNST